MAILKDMKCKRNNTNLNNQNRVNIFDSKKIISTLKSTPVKTDTVINNKNNNSNHNNMIILISIIIII